MNIIDHTDSGVVEDAIRRARIALSYEHPLEEIHEELMKNGMSSMEAHYAIVAAQILKNDTNNEES